MVSLVFKIIVNKKLLSLMRLKSSIYNLLIDQIIIIFHVFVWKMSSKSKYFLQSYYISICKIADILHTQIKIDSNK